MRSKKIVIFGCDNSGKTTLANELVSKFGFEYVRSSGPVSRDEQIEFLKSKLDSDTDMVFDRFAIFNSWGSARETFDWDELCRVQIPLPSIEVQQELVDTYNGLKSLAEQNEALVEQLSRLCEAFVVDCKTSVNENNEITVESVQIAVGAEYDCDYIKQLVFDGLNINVSVIHNGQ